MAGKIFINYRRGDDPGFTQALLGRLERAFSSDQLFIDIDNIEPGLDFSAVLADQVAQCDVVLAMIGKGWIDARDERNERRLDNPNDFVRIEITSALEQKKRVIPVLVGDARMPRIHDLPDSLKPLAMRNAVRLTHERFRADADGLIKAVERALEQADAQRELQKEAILQAEAQARHDQKESEIHKIAEEQTKLGKEASGRAVVEDMASAQVAENKRHLGEHADANAAVSPNAVPSGFVREVATTTAKTEAGPVHIRQDNPDRTVPSRPNRLFGDWGFLAIFIMVVALIGGWHQFFGGTQTDTRVTSPAPVPGPTVEPPPKIALDEPQKVGPQLVFPSDERMNFRGLQGGPFMPEVYPIMFEAVGGDISWTAESNSPVWLDISPAQGTVIAGHQGSLSLKTSTGANRRSPGIYGATISIRGSNGMSYDKPVTLYVGQTPAATPPVVISEPKKIDPHLVFSVAKGVSFRGSQGGPFVPDVYPIMFEAVGGDISWTAESNSPAWLDISPAQGATMAGQAGSFSVKSSAGANLRSPGIYEATISIKGSNGMSYEQRVTLYVGQIPSPPLWRP